MWLDLTLAAKKLAYYSFNFGHRFFNLMSLMRKRVTFGWVGVVVAASTPGSVALVVVEAKAAVTAHHLSSRFCERRLHLFLLLLLLQNEL